MAGGAPLAVREYASVAEMQQHAADVKARMFAPRPKPVLAIVPPPIIEALEPKLAEVEDDIFVSKTLEAFPARRLGKNVTIRECLRVVRMATETPPDALTGHRRIGKLVKARQIAGWALVRRLGKSLPEAGRALGGRDHTTILHACRRIEGVSALRGLRLPEFPGPPLLNIDPLDVEMVEAVLAAHVTAQIGILAVCANRLWAADWPDQIKRCAK